jgi:hypothetical protein
MKAHVHRHQRHAQRREQFQRGRREKGDAQHAHGAGADIFGAVSHAARGGVHRAQGTQRRQAAQAVEQEAAHAAHHLQLRFAGGLGAPTDDGHEDRDQGRGQHQDQRRQPRVIRHHQRDRGRHQHRALARRPVAHQPGQHGFGLLGQHAGSLARRQALAVERRT